MTDETPKPKRKRRRWIIAGVLLFVAGVGSVMGWWNWPRGDRRFVGKWTDSNGNVWDFRRNGTFYWLNLPASYPNWSSWQLNGDILQIGDSPTQVRPAWYFKLCAVIAPNRVVSGSRYKVSWLNDNTIVVDKGAAWGNSSSPSTLNRLP